MRNKNKTNVKPFVAPKRKSPVIGWMGNVETHCTDKIRECINERVTTFMCGIMRVKCSYNNCPKKEKVESYE